MLVRFLSSSKKTFIPLLLTSNIKLDGIPTRIKLKIQACFTLCFKFWEGTSVKRYKMQPLVLLFLVLHQLLYQQISSFYNFLELHSTLSEKDFCHKFSFFMGFTQTFHPLNSQNLLSIKTFLANFPWNAFWNFFKIILVKVMTL